MHNRLRADALGKCTKLFCYGTVSGKSQNNWIIFEQKLTLLNEHTVPALVTPRITTTVAAAMSCNLSDDRML